MALASDNSGSTRRAELAKARLSRRPSRLGLRAGSVLKPDDQVSSDAGFPGLLARTWQAAIEAESTADAVETLLTLGGHVPAEIQLMALDMAEECVLATVFGISWRGIKSDQSHEQNREQPAFIGEMGLTTGGRLVLRIPSRSSLTEEEDLVDGVIRIPWSSGDLAKYREDMAAAEKRHLASISDCRQWLEAQGERGREEITQELMEAALRTAPFVLYQGNRRYTNFRESNSLTGKTLWPGHPDCALSNLHTLPLDLWSDNDILMVVCLILLVRSAGFGRIEEANGTQLTVDHVAELLERTRRKYQPVADDDVLPPASSSSVAELYDLAQALRDRRSRFGRHVQLYREIHGPLMHKVECVAKPWSDAAQERADVICAHLRQHLPLTGDTLETLGTSVAASPEWLNQPHGAFATGFESLVYETVSAARAAFDADFAMSRGIRSLPKLIEAIQSESWSEIVSWELPEFYCCVLSAPDAHRLFDGSRARVADIAWAISARMQYNSWHFLPGNLPGVPEVVARDYFVPPTMPDIAYFSDQHHRGHIAAHVRFSVRSPQTVTVLDHPHRGLVDVRLLRCEGPPFNEQDLLAAHKTSAFIATATDAAVALVAAGQELEVVAFDSTWHWEANAGSAAKPADALLNGSTPSRLHRAAETRSL